MFVLGTAGHVDHGKSALVHALTGIDPDRLQEEKERGLTIDLGFAWLKLPSGREVGIVDVPGHEHFIRNMVAGVGGIDLAMLVIAANESIMPQTREHLAILDLLGIKHGVAVITKKDMVDNEWLSLVKEEVQELLASTILAKSPIVAVSAVTGEGLDELRKIIDVLLDSVEPKKDLGRPRLPIDRVFTIAGSGTIVTGTLVDGSLKVGDEVEIVPSGLSTRIRGLQTHKTHLTTATPGSRVGANVVGLSTSQLQRGDVLTSRGWLQPTSLITVQLRLLPYLKHHLPHNASVNFHTGTAETVAKVRLLDKDKLELGKTVWAQLSLEKPVVLVKGDRYIIRSPMETLGGGEIIESHPKRYRRHRSAIIDSLSAREKGTTEEAILALLESSQPQGLSAIQAQSRLPLDEVQKVLKHLEEQKQVVEVGEGKSRLFWTANGWKSLTKKITDILQDYHKKFPARTGMPKIELNTRLKLVIPISDILPRLLSEGAIVEEGAVVHLPAHQVRLKQSEQAKLDAFLKALAENPYAPPTDALPEPDLLNLLIERNQVVKVSDDVVFPTSAYNEMLNWVISHIKANGNLTVGELRDMFKTSRKYGLAFLDYLDRIKITRRVGDQRVLYR